MSDRELQLRPNTLNILPPSTSIRFQVVRIHETENKRLLFRGWKRFCLHDASVSAAEAASASATATASGSRTTATQYVASATAVANTNTYLKDAGSANIQGVTAMPASEQALRQATEVPGEGVGLVARAERAESVLRDSRSRIICRLVRTQGFHVRVANMMCPIAWRRFRWCVVVLKG